MRVGVSSANVALHSNMTWEVEYFDDLVQMRDGGALWGQTFPGFCH